MKFRPMVLAAASTLSLIACGGDNDPVANAINDALDVEIDRFELTRSEISPGQNVELEWRSEGAFRFEAKVYVSEDTRVSADDIVILDEDCSPDSGDTCEVGRDNRYDCDYENDLSFDCWQGNNLRRRNDLTPFLDTIPKNGFLILEICNDGDCDRESEPLRFL